MSQTSEKSNESHKIFEEYVEAFNSKYKAGFTQVPDIIDHLTYIQTVIGSNGEKEYYRKRLTSLDKDLYRVILKTCGKNKVCWKTTITLADEINCSVGSVVNSKRALLESFEQLDGGSLIDIEVKSQFTIKKNEETGKDAIINKRDKHYITCQENVMNYSKAHSKVKKHLPKLEMGRISSQEAELAIEKMFHASKGDAAHLIVHNWGARSPNESGGGARSPNEEDIGGARSPNEAIHTPKTIPQLYVKTDTVLNVGQEMLLKDKEVEAKDFNVLCWLKCFGVHGKVVKDLMDKYSIERLAACINNFIRNHKSITVKKSWAGTLVWRINHECR